MKAYATSSIRNVGLFSHVGAGKTSLAEAMLFTTGAVNRLGSVDNGSTVSDYDPDEVKRQISLNLSLIPVESGDAKINLLDTPGYADFSGEVASALHVSDGAVLVVDVSSGVQVGTEESWERITANELPKLIFVNRMDRENADYFATLESLQEFFGSSVAPLHVPIGSQDDFKGVVDLLANTAYLYTENEITESPVPDDLEDTVEEYRQTLIENVVELDDALTEKYLEGEDITAEELQAAVHEGVLTGQLTPVLCGAATRNVGVQALIDAIIRYLPSPAETAAATVTHAGEGQEIPADSDGPLAAFVYKTLGDPYVGKLSFIRVYSGTLRSDSRVWNVNADSEERIGQLLFVRGREQAPAEHIAAGDMGAVAKLTQTLTSHTLGERKQPLALPAVTFPQWLFTAAIEPTSKEDLEKLSSALARVTEEDPSLHVERQPITGQTLLSGIGETHINVALERMKRKFGADVKTIPVKVPYKETITKTAAAEGRFVRQTGGHGQYAVCNIEIEPTARGEGFEFVDKIFGGSISAPFREAVHKGVRESMKEGTLASGEVVDVRVRLVDGKEHTVDSSDLAFQIAGSMALKEAMDRARPVLLEPILQVRVRVPEDRMGDVIGDLTSRRAKVHSMDMVSPGTMEVQAEVPQAEVLRYATDLRSLTQGRATFFSEFIGYEQVPASTQEQVVEAHKREKEEASA